MQRKPSKTFKMAYCGIAAALSVALMLASLIPSMTYVFPAISGMLLWTVSVHISRRWALLAYAAASLLSFMLVPDIEANLFFILFFGYYPIVRSIIIEKVKPSILSKAVRFVIFNIAVVSIYFIICLVFEADKIIEGMEEFGDYAVFILWGLGNVAFILYDICLRCLDIIYKELLKPRFDKLFRQ